MSTERAIAKALKKGVGIHKVAKAVGVGAGTVQRVKATMRLEVRRCSRSLRQASPRNEVCELEHVPPS